MKARIVALSAVLALGACGGQGSPGDAALGTPEGEPIDRCSSGDVGGELPADYWGMHVADPVGDAFPDAPFSAVNLTTAGVYWSQVETAPGDYDFTRLDEIVDTAEEHDARPMVLLGQTPSFHAADPGSPTPAAAMPDPAAWRAWVTAVVDRYGDRLDYQVWPEPNISGNWAGTPAEMAELTVVAGQIVHERAPDALVVAPATALRLDSQQQWMDAFWATEVDGAPVADAVDAVALDPFPLEDGRPEDSVDLLCGAREILSDRGVDLPVWTNEINYGVPSGGNAADVQHYSDDQQAAYVARTYLLHAAEGVGRVYWLGWGSYAGMAVALEREGSTTPAGEAFSTVHGWLAGAGTPTCRLAGEVYTCVVEGGEDPLQIRWTRQGSATVTVPEGAARLQDVTGEERDVEPGQELEVGPSPVALVFS